MEFDLFSCTFENLNNLKFNELQKLSARFHVTKRWAKKREIIDKILLLRDQKIEENLPPVDQKKNDIGQENIEWVDGGKAFAAKEMDVNHDSESEDNDRRLTYCINTANPEIEKRRLTYKIEKPEHLILNETDYVDFDRRLTYNADDIKCHNMDLKTTASYNYDAIKKKKIIQNTDAFSKNIQPKPKDKLNMDNDKLSFKGKTESNIFNFQDQSKEYINPASSTVKRLAASCTRISGHDNARIKVKDLKCNAAKSIENTYNGKKSNVRLPENVKSAQILQKYSLEITRNNGVKSSGNEKNESQISAKSSVNCCRNIKNGMVKQSGSVFPRRKSKTEDNVLVRNFKPTKNLMFYSPKESEIKNIRSFSKPSNSLNLELTCRSKIPKAKPSISTQKPIVATKMPDFSKIHQKRFEQMDSLIDYMKKKEERAKKLFGLPHPGTPETANRNDEAKVFQFKSSNDEKENKLIKSSNSLKKDILKNSKGNKEKFNRKDVLSRVGSKPDIIMNLKEENRKHLLGVRTNKRFELQMKSRKLDHSN